MKRQRGMTGLGHGTAITASYLFWWVPSSISGCLRDFFAACRGKRIRAGMTTFQPALPAQFNCGLVFVLVYRRRGRSIFDLARENVTDQFAKLDGISGSFKALRCHSASMP